MLCTKASRENEAGTVPVYLNVYDLTPINGYAYWFGLGAYHSGVQVHGIEYAFGAHGYPSTGIFEGEPKKCEGFTYRKTILIGKTSMEQAEVRAVMEELAGFLCKCVIPATLNSTKVRHHRIEDKPCEEEEEEDKKKKVTSDSNRVISSNSSSSSSLSPSSSTIRRGRSRNRSRRRRALPPSSP
ncbi:hypothetical protein I3843_02G138700 [Carya illinoinensis]|uniref:deSI-like protein At4g17486 isoform X3 n=1 Tax=Carya illinoinensis TaxID=32201 RepID=UPI001BF83B65|nr:deSI-like protein At4g17486 isoform X3 [Carya illinoinensis]KAG2723228.1 hypothetical protein I3760_02G160700 [Carya illinoinensis]KAG7992678.1 hypothetical protein I3843_02G138700 [Carya illinoinensis]